MPAQTDRQRAVLAALSTVPGSSFESVQVQKLFFLIDERASKRGKWKRLFDFKPHFFGPFDAAVYQELEALEQVGLVEIYEGRRLKKYSLSAEGYKAGQEALREHGSGIGELITNLSEWVRGQTFAGLVGAIYREFPEMKKNSIFND